MSYVGLRVEQSHGAACCSSSAVVTTERLLTAVAMDGTAEVRGWLTLLWALVVGTATLIGVWVAVSNYRESTWQTKVASARKTYAAIVRITLHPQGADIGRSANGNTHESFGRDQFIETRLDRTNSLRHVALVDVAQCEVHVVNNSDEPMGDPQLVVVDADGAVMARYDLNPLTPGANMRVEVVGASHAGSLPPAIYLEYTDSAGCCWQRHETAPPRPFTVQTRAQRKAHQSPVQRDRYMT